MPNCRGLNRFDGWADDGSSTVDSRIQPASESAAFDVRIVLHAGARDVLRPLFELAEDSPAELDSYLDAGRVLVALHGADVIGHLQLVDTNRPGQVELKNMAVREGLQGRGIGRQLVRAALDLVAAERASTLVVATAAADIGNLRFYQRQGFRMLAVERDAFTPASGYAPGIRIDGIELRDRVWLDYQLEPEPTTPMKRPDNVAALASHIRIARPTGRIDELLAFYCDGLGLERIDSFQQHRGYSGVMLGLPGSQLHIEFTTHDGDAGHPGLAPTNDNLLVFYLPGRDAVNAVAERLVVLGHAAVAPENPYWLDIGALTFEDPDGWRVVLVPSAYS